MYKKAGINDIKEFYADKFAFRRNFDFTNDPLNFFDIDYFKFLWIYSQVAAGSKVLDFGCGSGSLACLKKKGCEITGVDISQQALDIAQEINGYDHVFCGDIDEYENAGGFDYVASLDVFGHIPFEAKDTIIERLKAFLKPGGVMLHGIECGRIDYDGMTEKELADFVWVDGHVGCEGKQENIKRFKKYFNYVEGEVRYDLVNSVEECLKQTHAYGAEMDPTLQRYLETMNDDERRAFNISAGLTMINLERQKQASSDDAGGFLFLRASDQPLDEMSIASPLVYETSKDDDLISSGHLWFRGWYPPETAGDKSFRWSRRSSFFSLAGLMGKELHLTVFSSYPLVSGKPIDVYFLAEDRKQLLQKVTLWNNDPVSVIISLEDVEHGLVEMLTDVIWVPKLLLESEDTRELGVGVMDVSIV
jgi:trans-aconitate methyltransferase